MSINEYGCCCALQDIRARKCKEITNYGQCISLIDSYRICDRYLICTMYTFIRPPNILINNANIIFYQQKRHCEIGQMLNESAT